MTKPKPRPESDAPFAAPDWPAARGTVMVKVALITPHPQNPHTHPEGQIDDIGASFEEFGVVVPPIVDENFRLMAGEGRWLAAKKKGLEELPCIQVKGWSEEKKRRFMVADIRLPQLAGFDDELYRAVLLQIKGEDLPLDALGLDPDSLARLLQQVEPPAAFPEYDESLPTEHECPKCGYKFSGGKSEAPPAAKPAAKMKRAAKKK